MNLKTNQKKTPNDLPDISKPFFVNGMEIDLGELEQFEKRLAEKRQQNTTASASTSNRSGPDGVDELDEYLDRLALDIKKTRDAETSQTESNCDRSLTMPSAPAVTGDAHGDKLPTQTESSTPANNRIAQTSLPLMLFGFFSILLFINTVVTNQRLGCKQLDWTNGERIFAILIFLFLFIFSL